jgi:hypothetical protein
MPWALREGNQVHTASLRPTPVPAAAVPTTTDLPARRFVSGSLVPAMSGRQLGQQRQWQPAPAHLCTSVHRRDRIRRNRGVLPASVLGGRRSSRQSDKSRLQHRTHRMPAPLSTTAAL